MTESPSIGRPEVPGDWPPRKRRRKSRRLILVSGVTCLSAAVFFLIASRNASGDVRARLRFAAAFGGAGCVLLGFYAQARGQLLRRGAEPSALPTTREGFALAVVLALGGALAALALTAFSTAAQDTARARRQARGRQLAAIAADEALRRLGELAADDPMVDHLAESWARPFAQRRPDGTRVESFVEDEERRLDLNRVKEGQTVTELVMRALVRCGMSNPRQLVARLRSALYPNETAETSATPVTAPLRVWADLTEIPGFDREVMERQHPPFSTPADVFTVLPPQWAHRSLLNVNTASPDVLFALFGPDHSLAARRLVAARETAPIRSLESLASLLANVPPEIAGEWLGVRSEWFRIEAVASDGQMERRVRVLARRETAGLRIVEWTAQ